MYRDIERRAERDALSAINAELIHRGPDDDGLFLAQNVGLAARRLSIIDVAGGHQPLANEDETIHIVYNGEIYNHEQLRAQLQAQGHCFLSRSDTETILHFYEEHGPNCVRELRGMFAFAIWDTRERCLFLARDRVGIKPLYYYHDSQVFLFASEIKSILKYPDFSAAFNESALSEHLAFGYLSGPETMFRGIRKLPAGHTLELSEKWDLKVEPYWDLRAEAELTESFEDCAHAYRELLERCVASHLMSDVPLGVFLSGGIDSSAIAALATKARGKSISTFSVGFKEAAFSEFPAARHVAAHLGAKQHEIEVSEKEFFDVMPRLIWHQDEPLAWPSHVALYFVAKLAAEEVKVVLTGEGSDETLGGYSRYAWTLLNLRINTMYQAATPKALRRRIRQVGASIPVAGLSRRLGHTFLMRDPDSWPSVYFDNFFSAFSSDDQVSLLSERARRFAKDAYENSMHYWERSTGELLHRMLYTDIKTYLVELLMKQDRTSMAASIESRVPFLDHELVEFAARIPVRYLIRGLHGKLILKRAVADLLPKPILNARKRGFPTPWRHWLAGRRLTQIQDIVLESRALDRGFFERAAIERLFEEHRERRCDHADRIWRLLNLELWQRIFVDGERPGSGIGEGSRASGLCQ